MAVEPSIHVALTADEHRFRSVAGERALRLAGPVRPEPLSPELVLVDPALRAEALARLPDRPWEAFLPAREEHAPAVAAPPALPEADEEPVRTRGRRGRTVLLLGAGVLIGLVVASVVPRPGGPTLGARSAVAPTPTRPATPRSEHPKPPQRTPTPTGPTHVAISGGGYVFGRSGHFGVSPDGTAITIFTSPLRCVGTFALPRLRLRGRRFGWDGSLRPGLHLVVSGQFESRTVANGVLQARSATCSSGRVPFSARLS